MFFLFGGKERTKEKPRSAECFRRGGRYFLFVHELSILHRSKRARLMACSKFCTGIYPFPHFVVPLPLQEVEAYFGALTPFFQYSHDCSFDG